MRKANINFRACRMHLNHLINHGLISKLKVKSRVIYKTTEKGVEVLSLLNKLLKMLGMEEENKNNVSIKNNNKILKDVYVCPKCGWVKPEYCDVTVCYKCNVPLVKKVIVIKNDTSNINC